MPVFYNKKLKSRDGECLKELSQAQKNPLF